MKCWDVDLKLEGQRRSYSVELLSSPLSRRSTPKEAALPANVDDWIRFVRGRIEDRQAVRELGIALFNALFLKPIDNIWHEAIGRTGEEGILRLRLDIRSHELMTIPWELVHDGSNYLGLSNCTPVVRYLHEHPSRRPLESSRPLNVLLVSSSPRDLSHLAKIEQEIASVKVSLAEQEKIGLVETLEHVTTAKLRDALSSATKDSYDVVHFMGHGAFRDGRGYLIFEDEAGNSNWREGESVGDLFRNSRIRLLFLNACDTAIPASDDWLIGVAHAAHASGIPAVIAMQQTILDRSAARFSGAFYRALALNQPLETCLVAGREAIKVDLGPDGAEWAIPVMFSNAPPGKLCSLWEVSEETLPDIRHAAAGKSVVSVSLTDQRLPSSSTDPMGRGFVSFQRQRASEAELLIAAMHDRGIPTWQNRETLDEERSESAIRKIIADPATSNAVLWLSPEVKSDRIRQLATGWILDRGRQQDETDSFFAVPVLAGGVDPAEVRDLLDPRFSLNDLRIWDASKVNTDPIAPAEAAMIARRVLNRRVAAIHRWLPEEERLRVELFTRPTAAFKPGIALLVDWVNRFQGRLPMQGAWEQFLLPALNDIAGAVQGHAPGRVIEMSGLVALPVATAIGCAFLAPRDVKIVWRQHYEEHENQLWSITTRREESGFQVQIIDGDPEARDVAVWVSVASNVEAAFEASLNDFPPFRGIVRVGKPGAIKHVLKNAGQALDVARVVIDGIRDAHSRYRRVGCIHLFMSAPAGLAMMIGQLLNKEGLVQTYEHLAVEGRYEPALLLYPSGDR